MDQTQFWQLIEQTKRDSQGDGQRQVQLVEEALQQLSLEEIEIFERMYQAFHGRSYSKRLWVAINEAVEFVSDDNFHYFRAWLIGQGEGIFREVMQYPERVIEFVNPQGEWTLEGLNYAAFEVYEQKTGRNLWKIKTEAYPLDGYDWLQPDTIEQGDI
jgi:hypothetical protein